MNWLRGKYQFNRFADTGARKLDDGVEGVRESKATVKGGLGRIGLNAIARSPLNSPALISPQCRGVREVYQLIRES